MFCRKCWRGPQEQWWGFTSPQQLYKQTFLWNFAVFPTPFWAWFWGFLVKIRICECFLGWSFLEKIRKCESPVYLRSKIRALVERAIWREPEILRKLGVFSGNCLSGNAHFRTFWEPAFADTNFTPRKTHFVRAKKLKERGIARVSAAAKSLSAKSTSFSRAENYCSVPDAVQPGSENKNRRQEPVFQTLARKPGKQALWGPVENEHFPLKTNKFWAQKMMTAKTGPFWWLVFNQVEKVEKSTHCKKKFTAWHTIFRAKK